MEAQVRRAALRKHFVQEMTLGSITDLSSVPVFGAAVYPVIVIAQREKRPVDQVMVQICVTFGDSPDAIELRQSTLAPLFQYLLHLLLFAVL